MSSTSSSPFPIRFACRAVVAGLAAVALLWPRFSAAQQEERVTEELARLLAAADTRVYDSTLFAAALRDTDPFVRRQAALAAGRIGDSAAVGQVIAALADPAPPGRATAAFALGLVKARRAVAPLAALARTEPEAITAIAKIGAEEGAAALRGLLENRALLPPPTALLEAWRLGTRAPVAQLLVFVHDPDAGRRRAAVYSIARLRVARGAEALVAALGDADAGVRVVALRGLSRTLTDSATLDARDVARRVSALVTDRDPHLRVNALRALASFRDTGLAAVVLPPLADGDVNVVVQAETTLGVLGGIRAAAALSERLTSATFALRRQAAIALAQADSAAGVTAAAALERETDWRGRSVAAEAFGAAKDRAGLEAELADPDGRVVAQALQTLGRIVPDSDARAASLARDLLEHADAAVRSVAADLLARHPAVTDVDRLRDAYLRAAQDSFNDARLSAVAALAAIAGTGPDGRAAVASGFIARVPRPDDYLVRRVAGGGGGARRAAGGPGSRRRPPGPTRRHGPSRCRARRRRRPSARPGSAPRRAKRRCRSTSAGPARSPGNSSTNASRSPGLN